MKMWALPVDALAFSVFHFDRGVLVLCPGGLSRLGWVLRSSYGHVLEQAVGVVVRPWLLGLDSFHVLYIGLAWRGEGRGRCEVCPHCCWTLGNIGQEA